MKQLIQDIISAKVVKNEDGVKTKKSSLAKKEPRAVREGLKIEKFSYSKVVFFTLTLVLLIVLSAKIINIFSKVVIQIQPHEQLINVDAIIKSGDAEGLDLPFENMEIATEKYKTMDIAGVKNVETKASGQIVIYNNYSSSQQTLIKNTRFEAPDGKIFRINKAITVPGIKIVNNETIPGSAEATVYADEAGSEYNVGLTDFTIPGFEGGPRYEKFFARSKTPVSGGIKGQIPAIAKGDLQKVDEALEALIKEELLGKAKIQTPENFVYFENAADIIFSSALAETELEIDENSKKFELKKSGRLTVPIFSKQTLSRVLATRYLDEKTADKVRVVNFEELNFELLNKNKEIQTISFKLTGRAKFVWIIDEEKVKEMLVASTQDTESVFRSYPAIERASIVFKPSWWHFFPKEKSRIIVEQIIPAL